MDVVMPVPAKYVDDVVHLFSQAWWTEHRTREEVLDLLDRSDITAGLVAEGRLVAFVRAFTDWRFKAMVMDLIVDESDRNAGLGRRLCDALLTDIRIAAIEDVELYCHKSLVGYYESMGFTEPPETRFMRRSASAHRNA